MYFLLPDKLDFNDITRCNALLLDTVPGKFSWDDNTMMCYPDAWI